MWVAEEGRGQSGATGKFYQKIMIAKMKSPWQFDGEPGIVTTPTQNWEYAGASSTHPRVVEGATPVYGKNGEAPTLPCCSKPDYSPTESQLALYNESLRS